MTGQGWDWPTSGPAGFSYAVTFDGGPFPVVGSEASVRYTAHRAGEHGAAVTISTDGFRSGQGVTYPTHTTVGAGYTAVTPTRLLDTRARIGTPTTTPVPAGGDILLPITELGGVPTADLTAVVVNVTVTEPTDTGFLTVYPDGWGKPDSSNVNFTPGRTVPNLVTVPVDGKGIHFHNSSSGTVHVVADLAGFYSGQGSGFKPFAPARVLDTRAALGTSGTTPLAAGDRLRLDLSGKLPAGATAAVLNLTATESTTDGFLTAYPAGQSLPNASNLNFSPGRNIANLAVVPVVDGKIDIRNSSSGTVHVVADLEGYYGTAGSGATQTFVPTGPSRIADTRSGLGLPQAGAVPARGSITVGAPPYAGCAPTCPTELLNVTVTEPADAGFLTVYPAGQQTPTASNLNFTPGATVPNLVSVPKGTDGRIQIFNGSFGTVHIVVDQEGYFFDARK